MKIDDFCSPTSVEQAVAILGKKGGSAMVLAGGTDVLVRAHRGAVPAAVTTIVSLQRIAALRGVRAEGGGVVIGAATTAADLVRDPVVARNAPILGRVANRLASAQIRNVATVGGNLVNASPAGDLINPLLLLDARLVIATSTGQRAVPVDQFFTGPGETVLVPGELLVEIRLDVPARDRVFGFEKAGTRPSMECSVVTVGLAATSSDGRLTDVRVVFGSCAPTPRRGRRTEAALEGQALTLGLIEDAVRAADEDVEPISDVRASECYRRALAGVFLRRLLSGVAA